MPVGYSAIPRHFIKKVLEQPGSVQIVELRSRDRYSVDMSDPVNAEKNLYAFGQSITEFKATKIFDYKSSELYKARRAARAAAKGTSHE